ncbi:MAG: hypothetical protein JOS17DRAFT_838226 [Linnemannia elongata]|nr:MAG: hypothetical protein JOS17DRAFT_838226 [Linnemannia elongata]
MLHKYLLAAAAIAACAFIPSSLASPLPAPAPSLPAELQLLNKRSSATVIRACTVPGTFAIKVTFFVNGQNYNDINDPVIAATVKRAYLAGHQIASHTWSHADLSLGTTDIASEMNKLDVALKALIGKRPVYMRPPYGNTSPAALDYLGSHGYKVINWNIDTNDWQHPTNYRLNLQAYKDALQRNTTGKTFISLQHDAEPMTAQVFSKLAIEYVLSKGFKIVPVGSCLGDNDGWYRD